MNKTSPIGILDSGVGGLSVLRAIRRLMPDVDVIYYADTANFPYGEKSEEVVRRLVQTGIERLKAEGCETIVLACNTASTVSLEEYQRGWPETRILGVAPLLGQAVIATKTGKIVVAATFATLASDYYRAIQDIVPDHVTVYAQACFDWVRLVESGNLDGDHLVVEQIQAFARHGVDTVVLGCTHFAFLEPIIRQAAPDMKIIEPGETMAQRLLALLGGAAGGSRTIRYIVTGDKSGFVAKAKRLGAY